ncbi:Membrane protein TerC, possibly involved in tellurium resistance [Kaistia soli DSM 19436]|uniref:Membrane protein TerC, possibly involved in tellurium resistance n=1 Tax=Kaistia soli DSM 19436 TaxID=1122133 RepID=A0A1M5FH15_9HYPH|nr:TerC family protein [Kaistia soli]SHF90785.1 Membrane protein TerC, possibly involved in tellurium resistance [Kaistia soli DSM 19436]
MNLDLLFEASAWASLLTLTAMEIVLGIDNIVFISVLVSRLPAVEGKRARQIGLALALVFRIALLLILSWLIGLTEPVITILGQGLSWRDLILLAGGLFLIYKATHEIHQGVEGHGEDGAKPVQASFTAIIAQIIVIDMVFSVDSIVTAIGMAEHVEIMIAAVVIAMGVMYIASGAIAGFIDRHPTTKMLALAFLLMIGIALVADGVGFHIPRGYIYTAMAFSAFVEILNVSARRKRTG